MRNLTRRGLLLGTGAALGAGGAIGWVSGARAPSPMRGGSAAASAGVMLDDASELSATPAAEHLTNGTANAEAIEAAARSALEAARRRGTAMISSAARHSMGGQSLVRDGVVLTLEEDMVDADTAAGTYRVGGGTRWNAVIRALDPLGFSPAVMQSNNDFGVASTYCVNAHGWPVPFSGCGATVRRARLLGPDGAMRDISRSENPEIFAAAMGGYGLFGTLTELELDMVPNQRLEPRFEMMPGAEFGPRFRDAVLGQAGAGPAVNMAYGRLDVSIDRFFEDAMMITYRPSADQADLPPAPGSGFVSRAARQIFRAQVDNERAKGLRWWVETALGPRVGGGATTRNALLNEPVITLDDRDPARTDILHEYFVAPEQLDAFLRACHDVIPNSYQQLLNVTLRYVMADGESLLAYAPEDRIAAVMLFSQEKSDRAEADMARMTRALIDRVLAIGGSYYLPYRPHATREQFEAAYPRAREFARLKRRLDPDTRFSNALWTGYLEPIA